jgi:hypothetical protein
MRHEEMQTETGFPKAGRFQEQQLPAGLRLCALCYPGLVPVHSPAFLPVCFLFSLPLNNVTPGYILYLSARIGNKIVI